MLRLTPEYQGATVVRSRNPELLEACDIIVDVSQFLLFQFYSEA